MRVAVLSPPVCTATFVPSGLMRGADRLGRNVVRVTVRRDPLVVGQQDPAVGLRPDLAGAEGVERESGRSRRGDAERERDSGRPGYQPATTHHQSSEHGNLSG